jgi:hypothetical protein
MSTEPTDLDKAVDSVFDFGNDMSDTPENNDTQPAGDDTLEGADTQQGADTQEGAEQLEPPLTERPQRDELGRVLDKDGNIIAGTKTEKDLFFQLNRTRAAAVKLNETNARLEGELKALRDYAELPKKLGLSTAEAEESLKFRAQIESDPVTAVREIVARVLANGYTMQQLFGEDAPAAINAAIINRTLDERLKPITDRYQSEEREQRIAKAAEEDLNGFLEKFPDAELHGELIARVVEQHGLTPDEAYYELKLGAQQRGLDFSKPLLPQMQAAQKQRSQPTQQRPTPGAHRQVASQTVQPAQDQKKLIDPNTSYKDIVALAMRAG